MLDKILISFLLTFILSSSSYASPYTIHTIDRGAFDRNVKIAAGYLQSQDAFDRGELPRDGHRIRIETLKKLLGKEPDWADGYWLLAAETYVLASTFEAPNDYGEALIILEDGMQAGEVCLKKFPTQTLCKFFLAACMAKKAALTGIFASLRLGFRIHKLWSDVLASNADYWFRSNSSLQGSVRYGLGIFYRLVPNRWIIETMFRIRGNIDRSVQLHREGVEMNPHDPCSQLMLGSALLCRCRGDKKSPDCQEGLAHLQTARQGTALDSNQRHCQRDGDLLLRDEKLACGFTQALQVDEARETNTL